jgi:hypothetical protein
MKRQQTTPPMRPRFFAIAILMVGFGIAALVYLFAEPAPANPLGYEPEESKRYVHDMLLYGGKANLLASEFMEWLGGLWYGRRLAFTIACIALSLAGAFLYFGAPSPRDPATDATDGNKRHENGA